ncbi:MAG TPA: hypothetical protein VEH08_00695 [Methanomassiliicoccales archaeon]|nr:hypothetical protein [Methanomassiliicoccales archaeon]
MKWRSHQQITSLVAEALELPEDLAELMVEASVDPDRNPLKKVKKEHGTHKVRRVRHHHQSRPEVMRLLWRARRSYLRGEEADAVWRLGRALHYVQDAHVRIGAFYSEHDHFEKQISLLTPSISSVRHGLESAIPSPGFVKGCLDASSPRRDPQDALEHAALVSASIAGAVLGETSDPRALERRLRATRLRHNFIVLPAAVVALASIGGMGLLVGAPYLIAVGVAVAAIIVLADRSYAFVSLEAEWNGIA